MGLLTSLYITNVNKNKSRNGEQIRHVWWKSIFKTLYTINTPKICCFIWFFLFDVTHYLDLRRKDACAKQFNKSAALNSDVGRGVVGVGLFFYSYFLHIDFQSKSAANRIFQLPPLNLAMFFFCFFFRHSEFQRVCIRRRHGVGRRA